jgi:rubrerythrin
MLKLLIRYGLADMPGTSQHRCTRQNSERARAPQPRRPAPTTELPGDSVCWLRMVCTQCGAMAESEPPTNCPQCGAPVGADR